MNFIEQTGFSGPDARERRDAEWARLRAAGVKHVSRCTTQRDKQMVYILNVSAEVPVKIETKVPLQNPPDAVTLPESK